MFFCGQVNKALMVEKQLGMYYPRLGWVTVLWQNKTFMASGWITHTRVDFTKYLRRNWPHIFWDIGLVKKLLLSFYFWWTHEWVFIRVLRQTWSIFPRCFFEEEMASFPIISNVINVWLQETMDEWNKFNSVYFE